MRAGEPVAEIVAETGISPAALFWWKARVLVDAGVREGVPSVEADEFASARKRIAALEVEPKPTRNACELFDDQAVVSSKGRIAVVEGLIARGHSQRSACRVVGVYRSTFLRQRRQPMSTGQLRRIVVANEISRIHARSRGTYGTRRVKAELLVGSGTVVNHRLVASIMSELGSCGVPRPKRRAHPLLGVGTPSGLVDRVFPVSRPNELWCADIAERPAGDGKVCCRAVLDCFGKKIVGRAFSAVADTVLVNNAVNMAMTERIGNPGLILRADHGSRFTSWSFGENLRRHNLLPSFGTVGDCFDNAAIESFWGRSQTELLNTKKRVTTLESSIAMADWIDNFYNTGRRHSYLGYASPTEYETLWLDTRPTPRLS